MLVRTLTRSAGKHCFEPGREIDLDLSPAELAEMVAAGALQVVPVPSVEVLADEPKEDSRADQPAGKPKRRA